MKKYFIHKSLFLSLLILLGSFVTKTKQIPKLIVISNAQTIDVTFSELKTIMRGEKQRWNNGEKVKLAIMKTTTVTGTQVSQKVYNMSTSQLNKYWLAQVFQGRVQAPKFFTSEIELESYVKQTKGAIGIVTKVTQPEIKIITIEGKKVL